jgi:putative membrane protein
MTVHDIPTLNAALNATATVLITLGFIFIKQGKRDAHRATMLTAAVVSALFLVGYVTHKILIRAELAAGHGHTPFGGEGFIRYFYYTMLISHIILAISIAYLVPRTFLFAIKGDIVTHKKWAKFTFPIWYYVSVTGVLVYFFLYVWWPATPAA